MKSSVRNSVSPGCAWLRRPRIKARQCPAGWTCDRKTWWMPSAMSYTDCLHRRPTRMSSTLRIPWKGLYLFHRPDASSHAMRMLWKTSTSPEIDVSGMGTATAEAASSFSFPSCQHRKRKSLHSTGLPFFTVWFALVRRLEKYSRHILLMSSGLRRECRLGRKWGVLGRCPPFRTGLNSWSRISTGRGSRSTPKALGPRPNIVRRGDLRARAELNVSRHRVGRDFRGSLD